MPEAPLVLAEQHAAELGESGRWIGERTDSSAAGADRLAAGEVVLGGERIIRRNIGQVLGVR